MSAQLTHGADCHYRLGHDCNCGMGDAQNLFVVGAKAQTQQRDWNRLRDAIRSRADHDEIERLWDRCERWIVTIPERGA